MTVVFLEPTGRHWKSERIPDARVGKPIHGEEPIYNFVAKQYAQGYRTMLLPTGIKKVTYAPLRPVFNDDGELACWLYKRV